ncbi:MAG TPA: hypothetical protein VFI47_23060 [Acidimicrobiales bacterium]|nr:hypothetical protein [Acidimicrobiales bacterium]
MDTNIRPRAARRIAYFRGRPASQWIDALSTRHGARGNDPSYRPAPPQNPRS